MAKAMAKGNVDAAQRKKKDGTNSVGSGEHATWLRIPLPQVYVWGHNKVWDFLHMLRVIGYSPNLYTEIVDWG